MSRNTTKPWYENSFGSLYSKLYAHRDDSSAQQEVKRLLNMLAIAPGAKVLDVCCGNGRHLQAMLEMGLDAYGVDLSEDLLRQARERAGLAGRVSQGDIRHLPEDAEFEVAFNIFTSFGYFQDDAENLQAMRSMAATIQSGGMLVVDHMNKQKTIEKLVPNDELMIGQFRVVNEREISDNRVVKHMRVYEGEQFLEMFEENVRLYTAEEMRELFAQAGLRVEKQIGDFDGADLKVDSPRMITIGKRL